MTFGQSISTGLNKFFVTTGRASRSEFWWYALFIYVIGGVIGWFGGFSARGGIEQTWLGIIFWILSAVLTASLICASIRRMHDTGKSGWNVCWYILPLIGWIIVVIMLCRESQPGENQYGPEPR